MKHYSKNQQVLIINNARPATDKYAHDANNRLRVLNELHNVQQDNECRKACMANKDCVHYKYDKNKEKCILYRREPYKITNNLNLNQCLKFCSTDNNCDYLYHAHNNDCIMFTRENYNGTSIIDNEKFNYPVYGYTIDEKTNKITDKVCIKNQNTECVNKMFTLPTINGTTVFFKKKDNNKNGANKDSFDNNLSPTIKCIIIFFILLLIFFIIYSSFT